MTVVEGWEYSLVGGSEVYLQWLRALQESQKHFSYRNVLHSESNFYGVVAKRLELILTYDYYCVR